MTTYKPMKHQAYSIKFLASNDEVFDMSCPGTGKTYSEVIDFEKRRKKKGKCALVLASKSLLESAWGDDIKKFAPNLTYSVAYAENREKAFAANADLYITNHDAAKWLEKKPKSFFAKFDTLILDECFPAGTLVDTPSGPVAIEMLKRGGLVYTSSGALPVSNIFVKQASALVEMELEDGTKITCTENHPFATEYGWVEARATRGLSVVRLDLHKLNQQGSEVLLSQLQSKSHVGLENAGANKGECSQGCTQEYGPHTLEQRAGLVGRCEGQAKRSAQSLWTQTKSSWGQRANSPLRSSDARDASAILGSAVPALNWATPWNRLSTRIQTRFRTAIQKMGIGCGWTLTQVAQKLRCEEGYIAGFTRVVRVSRIKCTSEVLVYNLQVDGPHTYSVAGVLVHNCSAFKHHTSQRSKAVAKIRKYFKYIRLMSGTPNTNGISDIWHQMFIVDGGKRLGKSFYAFRSAVCTPIQTGRDANMVKWVDKPNAEAIVGALIQDVVIRHKFEDCVDIPPNHKYSVNYHLSKKHMAAYKELLDDSILKLKDRNVTAINKAVLYGKLLQLASGAVYGDDGQYALIDTGRYELTMDMVEERSQSIVFFYWQHQRDELVKQAEKRGIPYAVFDGSVTKKGAREAITEHFQKGFYRVIFAHPKSAAHGLTWTKGAATIWPSATPNLEWYLQGLKRIHRIGQTQKSETIMVISPGTLEEQVYESLQAKNVKLTTLLDYLGEAA